MFSVTLNTHQLCHLYYFMKSSGPPCHLTEHKGYFLESLQVQSEVIRGERDGIYSLIQLPLALSLYLIPFCLLFVSKPLGPTNRGKYSLPDVKELQTHSFPYECPRKQRHFIAMSQSVL